MFSTSPLDCCFDRNQPYATCSPLVRFWKRSESIRGGTLVRTACSSAAVSICIRFPVTQLYRRKTHRDPLQTISKRWETYRSITCIFKWNRVAFVRDSSLNNASYKNYRDRSVKADKIYKPIYCFWCLVLGFKALWQRLKHSFWDYMVWWRRCKLDAKPRNSWW